ncbi:MAG: nitrogen fixation protein NifZ [Burkholderiales bacterium]|nr:nitrogen fixation protein NifZ [Burkholderiales bacterium]
MSITPPATVDPSAVPSLAGLSAGPREPRYAWGQAVVALDDLRDDGSHPDGAVGAAASGVLVEQGSPGEVVQVGHHADSDQPVYVVEFATAGGPRVVGCLEEEIMLASELADLAAQARAEPCTPHGGGAR